MFTGLIRHLAKVSATAPRGEGRVFTFEAPSLAAELAVGDSIAVDGCCLSVESVENGAFTVFASPETLARTTLRARRAGDAVNLERPLALGDRLDGHLVTGHVDGLGEITRWEPLGESWILQVRFPAELAPFFVEKGSVAVDGISLTTFDVTDDSFTVAVIPETRRCTNLSDRSTGDRVNLETDLIGKYVARQASLRTANQSGRVTEELLVRAGFLPEAAEG
jgi:riboflavin synthase